MAFRRDPHQDRLFEYRSRQRSADEADRGREQFSRAPRGLGWARRRDIDDVYSQQSAPRAGGRYDRTGEEGYARGFERFEAEQGSGEGVYRRPPTSWELDEGGVQFGGGRFDFGGAMRGPYRGRGPRGYQRSDERIREDVCEALTEADDVDAAGIEVQVAGRTVTLTGTVDDRYAKRRAEDIADSVSGVQEVQNHLRLQPGGAETMQRDRSDDERGGAR
jgi:hypothetical protein